ncbi:glucose-1-phosphate uridylyltransferase [Salmonella enterica subsp. enterica]|uniref:Glucose-1-phosphate uridylyltransferase n=1 Tax=Salmonella enterica I TaxID=59201 RepID=A0A447U255_SALET|nr:glucose-1-phosphate uridylyltransferase [Salmonella enterica subsp. enterica]
MPSACHYYAGTSRAGKKAWAMPYCARIPLSETKPVAVILPDVILDEYESDLSQDNLAEMIRRFDETGNSQIMVEPVEDVTAYGVVDCKGVELAPGESVPMVGVG